MPSSEEARAFLEERVIVLLAGALAARRATRGSEPGWRRFLSRDLEVAFHEAAHAVLASVLGRTVYEISICGVPDSSVRGFCRSGTAPTATPMDRDKWREVPTDRRAAVELCYLLAPDGPSWIATLRLLRLLRTKTMDLIESHWDLIAFVACELERRRELGHDEIIALLRDARPVVC